MISLADIFYESLVLYNQGSNIYNTRHDTMQFVLNVIVDKLVVS